MKLSIIIPSIRTHNWPSVYRSILRATINSFEVIFVGPEYNHWADDYTNIKFIRDFGSPSRGQQIGLYHACGEIVTHFADDCLFKENILDDVIELFKGQPDNSVVITKYTEGNDIVQNDNYYKLIHAYPYTPTIDPNWWIFNSAFFRRGYLEHLGGWDTRFHVPCVAHADLAIRAQKDKCNIVFLKDSICHCTHMPNRTGDHGAIHDAQEQHDTSLYIEKHNNDCNICIDINNWKTSPTIWDRYV